MWNLEHWSIGEADHYFSLRRDLILARDDWMIAAESFLGLEVPLSATMKLRFGAFDSVRHVFASGYTANQIGVFGMLAAHEASETVRVIQPFLRVGLHTHHEFRVPTPSVLFGLLSHYDLGAI